MKPLRPKPPSKRIAGMTLIELAVALGILAVAIVPLGYLLHQERQLARAYYYRAVAMEIVDGEMEILAAGEWRAFPEGSHPYTVRGEAANNLPAGKFVLTLREKRIRLEWLPGQPGCGGKVAREASAP